MRKPRLERHAFQALVAPSLRSGFVAGDPELLARFKRFRSYTCMFLSRPVLVASEALWRDAIHVVENSHPVRPTSAWPWSTTSPPRMRP